MSWDDWAQLRLREIDGLGRTRALSVADDAGLVSFASNDYLALSQHPLVIEASIEATQRWGTSAQASPLLGGRRDIHVELEAALAAWKGREAAVVLPSGFATNLGVVTALGNRQATVFSDELNHASIVDGCRLSTAQVCVYRHNDLDHLVDLLAAHAGPAVIVSDLVFSMDGDLADVDGLARVVRARDDVVVILDEAHAVFHHEIPLDAFGDNLIRVGTLSKTLGSVGGFVAASRSMVDLLINTARPLIFSTGLPPSCAAAANAALGLVTSGEMDEEIDRLGQLSRQLDPNAASQIVPFVVGSEQRAVESSARLLAHGFYVPAIRPPTVAPGTCRLRVALNTRHRSEDIEQLKVTLDEVLQ